MCLARMSHTNTASRALCDPRRDIIPYRAHRGLNIVLCHFTRSRVHVVTTLAIIFISWLLLQPWTATLIPDVANVAGMAKQFEPLMYASENVIPRSRELAEASIAVQDLGESVRATNMSASTVIIDQLDDLGDSLKVLSEKITSFFTNVDGDMDS
jgi:hypothetical protein